MAKYGKFCSPWFLSFYIRLADLMDEHREELATLESIDSGAVYTLALKTHVGMSIDTFRYFAGWCDKIQVRFNSLCRNQQKDYILQNVWFRDIHIHVAFVKNAYILYIMNYWNDGMWIITKLFLRGLRYKPWWWMVNCISWQIFRKMNFHH